MTNPKKKRIIILSAIGAVLIAAVILTAVLLNRPGRSVDELVGLYVDAIEQGDGEKMLDLMPEEYIDFLTEDGSHSKADIANEYNKMIEDVYNSDIDAPWTATYEITGRKKITGDELSDFQKKWEASCGLDIDAMEKVSFRITRSAKGQKPKYFGVSLFVADTGRDWCMLEESKGYIY